MLNIVSAKDRKLLKIFKIKAYESLGKAYEMLLIISFGKKALF